MIMQLITSHNDENCSIFIPPASSQSGKYREKSHARLLSKVQERRRENEGQKKKREPSLPFPPRSCVFSRLALFALTMEKGCLQALTFPIIRRLIRYIFGEPAVYVSNSKKSLGSLFVDLVFISLQTTTNCHTFQEL